MKVQESVTWRCECTSPRGLSVCATTACRWTHMQATSCFLLFQDLVSSSARGNSRHSLLISTSRIPTFPRDPYKHQFYAFAKIYCYSNIKSGTRVLDLSLFNEVQFRMCYDSFARNMQPSHLLFTNWNKAVQMLYQFDCHRRLNSLVKGMFMQLYLAFMHGLWIYRRATFSSKGNQAR